MKPITVAIFVLVLVILAIGGIIFFGKVKIGPKPAGQITQPSAPVKVESKMRLTSLAFENNKNIPVKYSCDGINVSPPLTVSGTPENTQSLVLIVDDQDAPAGDWVHWTVFNIDAAIKEIAEGQIPRGGIEAMTDFGKAGWGGPCPPSGIHRYQFKLYALDSKLDLGSSAKKQDIEAAMQGHILDQTLLVGLYQRQ